LIITYFSISVSNKLPKLYCAQMTPLTLRKIFAALHKYDIGGKSRSTFLVTRGVHKMKSKVKAWIFQVK